jgi:hypothetical protein
MVNLLKIADGDARSVSVSSYSISVLCRVKPTPVEPVDEKEEV